MKNICIPNWGLWNHFALQIIFLLFKPCFGESQTYFTKPFQKSLKFWKWIVLSNSVQSVQSVQLVQLVPYQTCFTKRFQKWSDELSSDHFEIMQRSVQFLQLVQSVQSVQSAQLVQLVPYQTCFTKRFQKWTDELSSDHFEIMQRSVHVHQNAEPDKKKSSPFFNAYRVACSINWDQNIYEIRFYFLLRFHENFYQIHGFPSQVQAFLNYCGFDFHDFQFTAVYISILLSSL